MARVNGVPLYRKDIVTESPSLAVAARRRLRRLRDRVDSAIIQNFWNTEWRCCARRTIEAPPRPGDGTIDRNRGQTYSETGDTGLIRKLIFPNEQRYQQWDLRHVIPPIR